MQCCISQGGDAGALQGLPEAACLEVCRLLGQEGLLRLRASSALAAEPAARCLREASARPPRLAVGGASPAAAAAADAYASGRLGPGGLAEALLEAGASRAAGGFRAWRAAEQGAFAEALARCWLREPRARLPPAGAAAWSLPGAAHAAAHALALGGAGAAAVLGAAEDQLFRLPKALGASPGSQGLAALRSAGLGWLIVSGLHLLLFKLAVGTEESLEHQRIDEEAASDLIEALHGVFFTSAMSFAQLADSSEAPDDVVGVAGFVRGLRDAVLAPAGGGASWRLDERSGWSGDALRQTEERLRGDDSPRAWAVAFYLHGALACLPPTASQEAAPLLHLLALVSVSAAAASGPRLGEEDVPARLGSARLALASGLEELRRCEAALARWRHCPGYTQPPPVRRRGA